MLRQYCHFGLLTGLSQRFGPQVYCDPVSLPFFKFVPGTQVSVCLCAALLVKKTSRKKIRGYIQS
jgi:hypothetical protein